MRKMNRAKKGNIRSGVRRSALRNDDGVFFVQVRGTIGESAVVCLLFVRFDAFCISVFALVRKI